MCSRSKVCKTRRDHDEGEHLAPPDVNYAVCVGLPCVNAGSEILGAQLDRVAPVRRETCLRRCWNAPASGSSTMQVFPAANGACESHGSLEAYIAAGGFSFLRSCLSKRRSAVSIIRALSHPLLAKFEGSDAAIGDRIAQLTEAGAVMRSIVIATEDPVPGIPLNSFYLSTDIHAVIDGILLIAFACNAPNTGISVSTKSAELFRALEGCMAQLRRLYPALEELPVSFHRIDLTAPGVAADLSGAIEVDAAFARCVPDYLARGQEWFFDTANGKPEAPVLYGVFGKVNKAGVYLGPRGLTIRNLIDMADGMKPGHELTGVVVGSWSNLAVPPHLTSLIVAPEESVGAGKRPQCVALVVLSDQDLVSRQCIFGAPPPNRSVMSD